MASEIDVTGLGAPDWVDTGFRWMVQAPLFVLPIVFLGLRSNAVRVGVSSLPQAAAYTWLVWGLLSALWAPDLIASVQVSLAAIGLWTTAAWFVWVFGFPDFARVFAVTASGFLSIGLIYDLGFGGRGDGSGRTAESLGRMGGLTFGPTNLGRFALVTVVLSVTMLLLHSRRDRVFWTGAGTGAVALVATGTRTSLAVLLVCLLALASRRLGPARAALIGAVVAVVVALVAVSLPDAVDVVSRSQGSEEIMSFNGRQEAWQVSMEAIAGRPVIGYGVRSEPHVFALASSRGELAWEVTHAHQIVLNTALTQGLVGLALLSIALGSYVAAGRRRPGFASVIVLAILLNGVTEAMLNRPTSTFLLLSAALAERALVPGLRPRLTRRSPEWLPSAQLGGARPV